MREEWGLKEPLPLQYLRFVTNSLQGDFGMSFQYRVPVRNCFLQQLPASLQLALAAVSGIDRHWRAARDPLRR